MAARHSGSACRTRKGLCAQGAQPPACPRACGRCSTSGLSSRQGVLLGGKEKEGRRRLPLGASLKRLSLELSCVPLLTTDTQRKGKSPAYLHTWTQDPICRRQAGRGARLVSVREPPTPPPTCWGTLFREAVGFFWAPQMICAWGSLCSCGTPGPSVPRRGEGARMKPGALLWAFASSRAPPPPPSSSPPPLPPPTHALVRLHPALALTPQSREVIHKKLGNSKL